MPQFFGLEVPKGEVSARVPPARAPSPSERAVIYPKNVGQGGDCLLYTSDAADE